MTVRVVTDSACDLSEQLVAQYDITVVPLTIRFGTEEFIDREQLSVETFWQRLTDSTALPETAAPSAGAFEAAFRSLAASGATGVICINLSSEVSATMQSAALAATAVADEIPVRVIDSRSVSMGVGLLVVEAARQAANGAELETIVARVESARDRTHLFATLDTLEFLKRGGRIGGAQALLGSLLAVKPIIEVRDGLVGEGGKVRTRAKALHALADRVRDAGPIDMIAIIDGRAPDLDRLRELVIPLVPDAEMIDGTIGPVVGTHSGPGVVGVVYRTRA